MKESESTEVVKDTSTKAKDSGLPLLTYPPKLNLEEAMKLNRHDRRRIGKLYGVKIGSNEKE